MDASTLVLPAIATTALAAAMLLPQRLPRAGPARRDGLAVTFAGMRRLCFPGTPVVRNPRPANRFPVGGDTAHRAAPAQPAAESEPGRVVEREAAVMPETPRQSTVLRVERAVPLTRLPLRSGTATDSGTRPGASDSGAVRWDDAIRASTIEIVRCGSDAERALAVDELARRDEHDALRIALHDRVDAIAARAALALVGRRARCDYFEALAPDLTHARIEQLVTLLPGTIE